MTKPNKWWRSKALLLWGEYIRLTQERCQMCGSIQVEAHHLISRGVDEFCCDPNNGILLCPYDHKCNPTESPHNNQPGFLKWLNNYFPKKYEWYMENKNKSSGIIVGFKENYFYIKDLIEHERNKQDTMIRRLK